MDINSHDDEDGKLSVAHDIPDITTRHQRTSSHQVQPVNSLFPANTTTTSISCTAVIFRADKTLLEWRVFADIPINTKYLGLRTDVRTILTGTLLAVLRQQLKAKLITTPPILVDIINGETYVQHFKITTTRVPDFGPSLTSRPDYCYRHLDPLSYTNVQLDIPPAPHWRPSYEISAVAPRHPLARDLMDRWPHRGLEATTHFVIIFNELPSSWHRSYASFSSTPLYRTIDNWRRTVSSAALPGTNSLACNGPDGGAAESFGDDGISMPYKSSIVASRLDEKGLLLKSVTVPTGQFLENQLEQAATVGTSFDPLELDLINFSDDNQHEQRSASLVSPDLGKTGNTSTSMLKRKYERLSDDGAKRVLKKRQFSDETLNARECPL